MRASPGHLIGGGVLVVASAALVAQAATSFKAPPPRPTIAIGATVPQSAVGEVSGFAFPSTIKVAEGGTVTWTNADSAPHSVTFDDAALGNVALPRGGTETLTFARKGTFRYRCEIHASMTGTVEVLGAAPRRSAETAALRGAIAAISRTGSSRTVSSRTVNSPTVSRRTARR